MAHEFAPYRDAEGPEGPRRTTMHYGPVVGGLPIDAWHCQDCGLLRLSYPDGRREERRLHPGPQPGLLVLPSPADPSHVLQGRQARVSGLSAPATFFAAFEVEPEPLTRRLAARLPALGAHWITVSGLVILLAGLLAAAYLSVYDYTTSSLVAPLAGLLAALLGGLILFEIALAGHRHLFPAGRLAPSVAETERGTPALDGPTRAAVWLLSLALVGLLAAGTLAVYDYQTPAVEGPVVVATLACGGGAILVKLVAAVRRHLSG